MKGIKVALLGVGQQPAELEGAINSWLEEHPETDVVEIRLVAGTDAALAMIIYYPPKSAARKSPGFQ